MKLMITTTITESNTTNDKPEKSRSRDPLSNITNLVKKSEQNNKKAEKKDGQVTSAVNDKANNRKRKSEPSIKFAIADKESAIIPHEDIDINDFNDPQSVAEYVNEIYEYLMIKEKDKVDSDYISKTQPEITEKMRGILVDWLVEVHRMFKLLPETLFLGIAIIDRYLAAKQISRDSLQLVGITSMLIASKYEEIYAPECNDFVYISDGAYTKHQILQMEQTILNTLNFNITHPSSLHFLRRYSKAGGSDYTLHTICKYLIELVLIDVKFLKYPPSLLAAASVYLGRAMTGKSPLWNSTLHHYSTYADSMVRDCALEMNELLKKSHSSSLKAIRKKYSLPKFGQVSELPLVDL
jgi:hypothetical protein